MHRILFIAIVAFTFVGPGCNSLVKKYDQTTVDQVDKTLMYENASFDLLMQEIDQVGGQSTAPQLQDVVNSVKLACKTRHDSEVARLVGWRLYEAAKQGAPESTPAPVHEPAPAPAPAPAPPGAGGNI